MHHDPERAYQRLLDLRIQTRSYQILSDPSVKKTSVPVVFNTKGINHDQVFSRQSSQLKSVHIREEARSSTEAALRGKQKGADWTAVFAELNNAIKIRHYSPKPLKTYTGWTRKFQTFVKSKDPNLISVHDVKKFLTWLAVDQGVAASSQNQAFNALLFLFSNVFKQEFGKVDGIVRAKRKPYIPVVLSIVIRVPYCFPLICKRFSRSL